MLEHHSFIGRHARLGLHNCRHARHVEGDGELGMISRTSLIAALLCGAFLLPVNARDLGQWTESDAEIAQWFQQLKQPDNTHLSCCGEADAYWADDVLVDGEKVYAIITDDRPDGPLRRKHVPVGTKILVPPHKYKYDQGNPTGHVVIFLSNNRDVYCYVMNGGV